MIQNNLITCKNCKKNFSIEIPIQNKIFYDIGLSWDFNNEDEWKRDDLFNFYGLLLNRLLKRNNYKFQNFDFKIEYTEPTKCPFCFSYNEVYCCEDISNGFYIYISKQIKTILNSLSIKNLGISMDEVYQTYSFDREYLINHLPFKYKKEKRLILKMKKLQEKLPYTGGNGGDFNLIEWLVENAVTAIYTTLVVSLLTVPTKKILTSAKQSLKVRKRIRTYIQDNQTDFSDISMEDIKKYFHVPRNFNGSKEELIEDIIYKKAEHVKKELIEKLRPSIVQKKMKLKSKSTKNQ